ncbi:MAG: hypothetical protein HUU06_00620 [Planctomycetaceae bacterium]|nr:hypothetical protein [Planctomycetota bacterium]NUN51275.1 hypothetical protein [Planctomycetaceae bacterium]
MSRLAGRIAAVAAFVLLLGPPGVAGATRGGPVRLREPVDGSDAAASGVMVLRAGSRGERLRLRVLRLGAARKYELRDRRSSETLGVFLTSGGGTGRLRLLAEPGDGFCGRMMEVVDAEDGSIALEGEGPLPEIHGDEAWDGMAGSGPDGDHHDRDMNHGGVDDDGHQGDGSTHGDGSMHGGDSMHGGSGGHL